MFAALHGGLTLHPWRDPFVASSDAYSLFVAGSSAMSWLAEADENASGGLWGMNDAGQGDLFSESLTTKVVAWFQVSLTEAPPARRPLPVEAFLSCAGDVVTRLGTLLLEAVQLLLPVQTLDGSTAELSRTRMAMLYQSAGRFADPDPQARAHVRVTVDGGQNPLIRAAAPEMVQWLKESKQDVFSCDSYSLSDDRGVLEPAIADELWVGPAEHRATFQGTLAAWSLDTLGWLAAFFAEVSSRYGVRTPVMLTACRVREEHAEQDRGEVARQEG